MMRKELEFLLEQEAATIQERDFIIPSNCCHLSIAHDLSTRYTFLVFLVLKDPGGQVRFQKQLGNSEPVISIGKNEFDTTIGGVPGKIQAGKWTLTVILFAEHLKYIMGSDKVKFHMVVSNKKEVITEMIDGKPWVDNKFRYSKYDFKQVYQTKKKWYKGDLHTHTCLSDGKELPAVVNINCRRQKMDFYVATEHNVLHTGWPKTDVMITPGVEITTKLGHANLFGIDQRPKELDHILMHNKKSQLEADLEGILEECEKRGWLFSINHPFLYIWKWLWDELPLKKLNCLEIINDPTYAADPDAKARKANEMAVMMADLLWEDGYRICAIGGSDVHNSMAEKYPGASQPSVVGDPATYLYMNQLTPENMIKALKKCRAYVVRNCEIKTNIPFGKKVKEDCEYFSYEITFHGLSDGPEFFYLLNGRKVTQAVEVLNHGVYRVRGKVQFTSESYQWVRFGARTASGEFIFYGNPITRGEKKKHKYKTFEDVRKRLEKIWKSKESYLIKTAH